MSNFNVNPYRAVSFNEKAIRKAIAKDGSVIVDTKYDGVRGCLVVEHKGDHASAEVFTRTNKTLASLASFDLGTQLRWKTFLEDFIFPTGMMIDGELMVKGETFQKSAGILRRKTPIDPNRLQYVVYAVLPIEDARSPDDYEMPMAIVKMHAAVTVDRLTALFPEIEWILAASADVFSFEELEELYAQARKDGLEGLLIKETLGNYKRGKKSGWWKMKPEDTIDGIVQGLNWGTKGLANEGKVIGFEVLLEDGTVCSANGITDYQKALFTQYAVCHGESYFNNWSCEVSYMERTDDGGLRHPSFLQWRGQETNPIEKV